MGFTNRYLNDYPEGKLLGCIYARYYRGMLYTVDEYSIIDTGDIEHRENIVPT